MFPCSNIPDSDELGSGMLGQEKRLKGQKAPKKPEKEGRVIMSLNLALVLEFVNSYFCALYKSVGDGWRNALKPSISAYCYDEGMPQSTHFRE